MGGEKCEYRLKAGGVTTSGPSCPSDENGSVVGYELLRALRGISDWLICRGSNEIELISDGDGYAGRCR